MEMACHLCLNAVMTEFMDIEPISFVSSFPSIIFFTSNRPSWMELSLFILFITFRAYCYFLRFIGLKFSLDHKQV